MVQIFAVAVVVYLAGFVLFSLVLLFGCDFRGMVWRLARRRPFSEYGASRAHWFALCAVLASALLYPLVLLRMLLRD